MIPDKPKSLTYVISILQKNNQFSHTQSIPSLPTQKQINEAKEELTKINNIFTQLNLDKEIDQDCPDMGELSEIIKFSR